MNMNVCMYDRAARASGRVTSAGWRQVVMRSGSVTGVAILAVLAMSSGSSSAVASARGGCAGRLWWGVPWSRPLLHGPFCTVLPTVPPRRCNDTNQREAERFLNLWCVVTHRWTADGVVRFHTSRGGGG